jgi:hypothetical protein
MKSPCFFMVARIEGFGVVQTNLCKHLFSFSLLILDCLHHQWSLFWLPFLKSMLFVLVFVACQ